MAEINVGLYCNFKRCRTPITSTCWITSCSHVFCNNHRHIDDSINKKCPVCNTVLNRQYDFVESNVNPPEEYKSMVLAGLSPATVFDIASRAVSFWNFQNHIEETKQSLRIKHLTTRLAQLESSYETMTTKIKNDIQVEEVKKEALQNEVQMLTTRLQEANKSIFDKNRQLQSLKQRCDELLRENVTSRAREEEITQSQQTPESFHSCFIQDHMTIDPYIQRSQSVDRSLQRHGHHGSRSDFKFNPMTPSRSKYLR